MNNVKKFNLDFGTSFSDIKDINPHFAIGKMRIAYAGRNRNNTEISKEVFEEAIPTMFNCPVVVRYDREKNMFGGHDIEVVVSDNTIKVVNATSPIGIVPAGAQWCWEDVTEDNDLVRQYLCVEVLFWKRQEAYDHLLEIGSADQSMEVDFVEYHKDDDGFYVADKICFSAFCLLESVEPCFESASVELFAFKSEDEYKRQFALMLDDLREYTEGSKEGDEQVEELEKVMSAEEEVVEVPAEEAVPAEEPEEVPVVVEAEADEESAPAESFSAATYRQKFDALVNALSDEVIRDEEGRIVKETYYWVSDFDDEFVFVERHVWEKGDHDCQYGRFAYAFNEESLEAVLGGEFEKMIVTWLTEAEHEALIQEREAAKAESEEFAAYKESHSAANEEVEELRTYKAQKEASERETAINELFAQFEDLSDNEEFKQFSESEEIAEMELSAIEDKCFMLRGKATKVEFAHKSVKLPAINGYAKDEEGKPYGGLFEKYGVIKNKD